MDMEEVGETGQLNEKERITRAEKAEELDNGSEGVTGDEMSSNEEELKHVEKIIPKLEEMQEERPEAKIKIGEKESVTEKVGESSTPSESLKRPKLGTKQVPKKPTIPQPFSLATERRSVINRARRASVDLSSAIEKKVFQERRKSVDSKDFQPKKLSKSASLNLKAPPSTASLRETPNFKSSGTTARSLLRTMVASAADKKIEKHMAHDLEKKNSTFKASPLPSFYSRKSPPSKPDIKKIAVTRAKSPLLGRQRSKSATTNAESRKMEEKCKSTSTVSKTLNSSARETINKLFKSTRKALDAPKEAVKCVVSKA